MSDRFDLSGSYVTTPLSGEPSLEPSVEAPIDESLVLGKKTVDEVALSSDSPVSVSFGGVTNAHVVVLKSTNGTKVKAEVTSSDGTDQAIPFDTVLILITEDVAVTALKLTRETGVATAVRVFLGEKS